MAETVIVPIAGIGVLMLERTAYEAALAAGAALSRPPGAPATSPVPELLDAEQVAQRLHLPQNWIEEAARQGRVPCIRFGRYTRYSLAEVVEAAKRERRGGLGDG